MRSKNVRPNKNARQCKTARRIEGACLAGALLFGASGGLGASAPGVPGRPAVPPASPLLGVLLANQLTGPGKPAFHLRASFQIFGVDGKPLESGTAEEWWTGESRPRVEFRAPSFGTLRTLEGPHSANPEARRSFELAKQLLGAIAAPANSLAATGADFILGDRIAGGLRLHCMQPGTVGATGMRVEPITVCFDDAETIRSVMAPGVVIARSDGALFHGTRVARRVRITAGGKAAIAGEVISLEGLRR